MNQEVVLEIVKFTRKCDYLTEEEITVVLLKRYKHLLNKNPKIINDQNIFMENEISRLQNEENVNNHKQAIKIAKENWKKSEANPKYLYNKYMSEDGLKIKNDNQDKSNEEIKKLVREGWKYNQLNPSYNYNISLREEISKLKEEKKDLSDDEILKQAKLNCKVSTKKLTGPKTPSPYNKFMKDQISIIKKDNPELTHKEAFRQAAAKWNESDLNPKNNQNLANIPSPYNKFMKDQISIIKKDNPELTHKEAFKEAAAKWKESDLNPKKEQNTVI